MFQRLVTNATIQISQKIQKFKQANNEVVTLVRYNVLSVIPAILYPYNRPNDYE